MHDSSRRDKGQLKANKLKTVFIQHTVNKITLSFHFIFISFLYNASCQTQLQVQLTLDPCKNTIGFGDDSEQPTGSDFKTARIMCTA